MKMSYNEIIQALENGLKVRSKYFSNYTLLYVVLNGTRYQINDKQFDFKHGII